MNKLHLFLLTSFSLVCITITGGTKLPKIIVKKEEKEKITSDAERNALIHQETVQQLVGEINPVYMHDKEIYYGIPTVTATTISVKEKNSLDEYWDTEAECWNIEKEMVRANLIAEALLKDGFNKLLTASVEEKTPIIGSSPIIGTMLTTLKGGLVNYTHPRLLNKNNTDLPSLDLDQAEKEKPILGNFTGIDGDAPYTFAMLAKPTCPNNWGIIGLNSDEDWVPSPDEKPSTNLEEEKKN